MSVSMMLSASSPESGWETRRSSRLTHFLECREYKIVFKRYASLYFAACVEKDDNELIVLDVIHHFVEVLDRYFSNVCELDLIFNFH